jgi:hypothetical protein
MVHAATSSAGTAVRQAVSDRDTRAVLVGTLREIDRAFAARIERRRRNGELSADADPANKLASATPIHPLKEVSREIA